MIKHLAAWLLGLAVCQNALCQEAPGETPQTVQVNGVRTLPFVPYTALLRAQAAFDKHRALAPAASLRYSLQHKRGSADLSVLRMQLQSAEGDVAIPVQADGSFVLPSSQPVDPKAELVLNRPKDEFTLTPVIMSPGTTPLRRRLGDMRLECRLSFVLVEDDLPFWLRNGLKLAGGPCTIKKFSIVRPMPAGTHTFTMIDGQRRTPSGPEWVRLSVFKLPYYDKTWSDDTLIVFGPTTANTTSAGTGERTAP